MSHHDTTTELRCPNYRTSADLLGQYMVLSDRFIGVLEQIKQRNGFCDESAMELAEIAGAALDALASFRPNDVIIHCPTAIERDWLISMVGAALEAADAG